MKTKIFLLSLALGHIFVVFSQKATLELTYTATDNGQYIPLDSVFIENLTQGGDTILYAPDTILVLDYITGIGDNSTVGQQGISVSQNYPNPFSGQTTIYINVPEKEKIEISICDILGREVANYKNVLAQGNHSFIFHAGDEKYYLLTVTGQQTSRTIKMLNANHNTSIGGNCKIVHNEYANILTDFKSQKAINNFAFNLGDELRYTGYAITLNEVNGMDIIEDAPLTNKTYEFEITGGVPCPGIPTVSHGGQEYNTVLIGSQCWLKENLNIGNMINAGLDQQDNDTIEKYCYGNDPANCETYGGLYQWNEMMQYASAQGVQGICPPDWHLPTDEEWKQLEGEVDNLYGYPDPEWDATGWRGYDAGLNLKATNSWLNNGNGNDLFGFTALPGGYRKSTAIFVHLDFNAFYWASTINSSYRRMRRLSYDEGKIYRYHYSKSYGFSVRCIKDD